MSLFVANVLGDWDGHIAMQNVIENGKVVKDWMELTKPLPCGDELLPIKFKWNGASVGPLRFVFPKWKHPVATGRHDARCGAALTWEERLFADKEFKEDVRTNGSWWEIHAGYAAVRAGARLAKWRGELV
jgi:hypothetical protein